MLLFVYSSHVIYKHIVSIHLLAWVWLLAWAICFCASYFVVLLFPPRQSVLRIQEKQNTPELKKGKIVNRIHQCVCNPMWIYWMQKINGCEAWFPDLKEIYVCWMKRMKREKKLNGGMHHKSAHRIWWLVLDFHSFINTSKEIQSFQFISIKRTLVYSINHLILFDCPLEGLLWKAPP